LLAYALFEADWDRQFWIDTDHLLRGLLRFPNAATESLTSMGLTLESVRSSAKNDRKKSPPEAAPKIALLALKINPNKLALLFVALTVMLVLFLLWRLPVS
jgi:hypothetical protein